MAVNKVVINRNGEDEVLVDLTGDSVVADSLVVGFTAHDKSGNPVTGKIPTRGANDITASGATVTVPAGYYASQETKKLLSPLDDAVRATASDMAQGKQLYDENGNLVEGGLKVWTGIVTQNTLPSYDEASGKIILNANHTEKVIVDKGNMIMRSYASNFGNAKREEVVKGKFFTSEAGLMVEGGLEVGTPETWTLTLEDGSTVSKVVYVK